MSNDLRIDCRGVRITGLSTITVSQDDRDVRFVREDDFRATESYHACLFVDREAHNDDALLYPKSLRFAALMESPIDCCHRDFDKLEKTFRLIFTDQESLVARGAPYVKLLYGTNWLGVRNAQDTQLIREEHPEKDRLVSFLGSILHDARGAYDHRREAAKICVADDRVDAFGRGIKEIDEKREAIQRYRFSVTMENVASDLYFSEKLVDCLLLETVPIYYGCPGIEDLFDVRGMLCFDTLDEMKQIIGGLTHEQYQRMYPYVRENKRRVIENGWHCHQARFEELTPSIVDFIKNASPVRIDQRPIAHARRMMSRMTSRVASRLKRQDESTER